MIAWLASLLERLPPPVRRVAVVALALLALGAVAVIVTPSSGVAPRSERAPTRASPTPGPARPGRQGPSSPVPAVQLVQARRVAVRFLASYLPFAYGRAGAGSVSAITPALRGQLIRERAQVTPVERRRHPRVASLQVVGKTVGVVVATAMIEDGGITTYAQQFTLEQRGGGWAVSSVGER
jgi:hypothetical protein